MEHSIETVVIIDFGSQYTQLIARRVRELNIYSEIIPCNASFEKIVSRQPKAIILSGGPASVSSASSPVCSAEVFKMGIPILGICYGMQLMAKLMGGEVLNAARREYGKADLNVDIGCELFSGLNKKLLVWMSHGDKVTKLPPGFEKLAHSTNSQYAVMGSRKNNLYGLQFHPEVVHTPQGRVILKNYLYKIAGCAGDWNMKSFVKESIRRIRDKVGNEHVVCALSGGVDSSVLAVLLNRAIGKNLTCIFVDNGVLRKDEHKKVINTFKKHFKINLRFVNAGKRFLTKLKGITDPEEKRKIIGTEFIRVFEEAMKKLGNVQYLAQGTLYPDVIESISFKGAPSATIKSHHNVGGLPKNMKLKLIEPFRELFKDEVREVGKELGLPEEVIWRQPFPGPGLAVRIVGDITKERLKVLKEADAIVVEEIKKAGLYREIWQSFAVLLPVKSVGVMGDERTYENTIAIRAVNSKDGMTADWVKLPYELLCIISNRIINEVKGVNRVVYDISSKPPSTIEWE